jgi:hypothetical protein
MLLFGMKVNELIVNNWSGNVAVLYCNTALHLLLGQDHNPCRSACARPLDSGAGESWWRVMELGA